MTTARRPLPDLAILLNDDWMAALRLVAAGRVRRDRLGTVSFSPPLPTTSRPVTAALQALAMEEVIDNPVVGRAFLTGRGRRILATERVKDSGHRSLHDAQDEAVPDDLGAA